MRDILSYCLNIPYNSCYKDLPPYYSEVSRWGTDCFGFAQIILNSIAGSSEILGTYNDATVHAAILVNGGGRSLSYVDPFLRMKEALPIHPGATTQSDSYYRDSVVIGTLDKDSRTLKIWLKRHGYTLHTYTYNLHQQDGRLRGKKQDHGYRFSYVFQGNKVVINKKKTLKETTAIEICGEHPENADAQLRRQHGISLHEVARMFYDVGQNAGYLGWLSFFGHR